MHAERDPNGARLSCTAANGEPDAPKGADRERQRLPRLAARAPAGTRRGAGPSLKSSVERSTLARGDPIHSEVRQAALRSRQASRDAGMRFTRRGEPTRRLSGRGVERARRAARTEFR